MKRTELNNEELNTVVGGDYWTDQGYSYVGQSGYFTSNEEAWAFAENNKEALRQNFGAYSFAYLVDANDQYYFVNYYTREY